MQAALGTGCDAIHPGYGFLSERAALAALCEEEGVIFIGPTAAQIDAVGDKLKARFHAEAADVPVVPGGPVDSPAEAQTLAERIGAPLLVKAVGGVRRARHEAGGGSRRPGRDAGHGLGGSRRGLRRRARLSGALCGAGAAYRGSAARRWQRQGHSPRRARLLGAAALPEAHRGDAGARSACACSHGDARSRRPFRPKPRLSRRRDSRVPLRCCARRPSIFSK